MSTLALSMIVRDAERELPACLESVRGLADEMVVADTGSTDGTIPLARSLGARVISIPWENDFARARNLALAEVRADWVLVLDADEQLDPGAARVLPSHLENHSRAGYLVTIRNYVLSETDRVWDRAAKQNDSGFPAARRFPAYVEHENVRLFRRDPAILFVGRVHESVGPRIVELGRQLAPAGFVIHHFGLAADAEVRERKNRLYRELGQQKIREMPRDAQAHLELGLVELDNFDNPAGALQLFQRACELNRKLGVAWFFAGVTQCRLNLHQQAVVSLKQAERLGHATPLVAETMGDAHYNLGEFSHACHCYERALRRSPGDASVESKLGLAEVRSGQVDRGLRRLLQAIEHQPTSSELHDRLIMAQVWLGQLEEAAKTAEVKLAVVEPSAADFLRAASIWARLQAMPRAENLLRAGLARFPEVEALQSGLEEVQRQGASICQPDAPV